jgi:8-oxo-dGTP pyrophosphatase MutT (NUDIX family)
MLLGKRGRGPNAGKWVIPGGGVEAGEHWRATGLRELREETGLTAEIIVERPWVMEILSGKPHRVTLCVRALIPGSGGPPPMPRAGSDLAEVRWFSAGELDALDVSPAVRPTLDDMLGARVRDGGRS